MLFLTSRICSGNLPTERVTKRDLFHVFHKYGKLAQISIKQAYGFVQFLDATACYQALQAEQGGVVRGRKIRTYRCFFFFLMAMSILVYRHFFFLVF